MRGPPKQGSIYFIRRADGEGPIKIGISARPNSRLGYLEREHRCSLQILALIDGPAELEKRFHCRFKEAHVGREWFEATTELLEAISAIAAGTFDVSGLPEPINLIEAMRPPRRPWSNEQRERHLIRMKAVGAQRRARAAAA